MRRVICQAGTIARFGLLVVLISGPVAAETNWPGWRGPAGTGVSHGGPVPVKWDRSKIAWRTELVGSGQSSPVVWDKRVFLTSFTDGGRKRHVLCLDRTGGKLLWDRVAWTGEPEPTHSMNQYASATCSTDGEIVVAFFGRGGLHAYDFRGNKLWERDLGPFEGPWGTAASPVIWQDLVIQNCDAENAAYLLAVDKESGETRWKTPRDKLRGWSTPLIVQGDERTEVVLNGERGVTAYDPQTGQELWFCRGDRGRGTPTVTIYGDLRIAVAGRPGDMIAVRGGGSGVVNETHEVWRTTRRGGRDLPSPIVVDEFLVVVNLRPGVATCYDAATGRELDRMRLDGNFSASPVAAGGLIYIPNEDGRVFVLKPGRQLTLVARNEVPVETDEVFRASLTPHDGQLLLRSDKVLYCIGD